MAALAVGCATDGVDPELREDMKGQVRGSLKRSIFGTHKEDPAQVLTLRDGEFVDYVLKPVISTLLATTDYQYANQSWPRGFADLDAHFRKLGEPFAGLDKHQRASFFPDTIGGLEVQFPELLPNNSDPDGRTHTRLTLRFSHTEGEVVRVRVATEPQTRICMLPEQQQKSNKLPELVFGIAWASMFQKQYYPGPSHRGETLCIALPVDAKVSLRKQR
jgi:hypothetical protein